MLTMLSAGRVRITFLLLSVAVLQAPSALVSRASAQSAPTPKSAPAEAGDNNPAAFDHLPAPELIAVTWQMRREASDERIKQPVWRPDGTRLTDAETIELLDQVKSFQSHWWNPGQLRPLVLVFRREGTIESGLSAAIVLPDGRKLRSGTWGRFEAHRLTKSACAPLSSELARWPESVDLDVKVPLEDQQVIKTVQGVPDGAVEVAPGVRWYVDPDRGIDFKGKERREHLTAAVLELEDESADSLVVYDSTVRLRGQEGPLRGAYVTQVRPRPGPWYTIRVSDPLDDVKAIERVEFTRQRFKMKRFTNVKLRLDLMPPPEEDEPSDNERSGAGKLKKRKTVAKPVPVSPEPQSGE